MKHVIVNSKFEYKVPNSNMIVNIEGTILKNWLIEALKDGSNGISNVDCFVTNEPLSLMASTKLNMIYDSEFEVDEDMTEEDIENEDKLI